MNISSFQPVIMSLVLSLSARSAFSNEESESRPPAVRPGVSRGTVIHHLGEPKARIETRESARYYYERGEVRLVDDVVTHVSLMSEEAAEEKREQAAREREANTQRGIEVRDKILADAEFAELPPSDRATFWKEFRDRYPEVNVEAEYEKARLAAKREAEKRKQENRLAHLENRVRETEERARRLENEAADRAWPDVYSRNSRYSNSNSGVYIRYDTGRRYYDSRPYLPIVISTNAHPQHPYYSNDFRSRHQQKQHLHPQEKTDIHGKGGNTRLNIKWTGW